MKIPLIPILGMMMVGIVAGCFTVYGSGYASPSTRSDLLFLNSKGSADLSDWGHWTDSFVKNPKSPTVSIFQRWSLAESLDSKINREERYPMQESESELFRALANFIPTLPDDSVIVTDSCSGVYSKTHQSVKNGWTFQALEESAKDSDFTLIPTFLPWKLEMILDKSKTIICGENDFLVGKQDAVLSLLKQDLLEIRALRDSSLQAQIFSHFRTHLLLYDQVLQARADDMVRRVNRLGKHNIVMISHSALSRYLVHELKKSEVNVNVFETRDFRLFAADPDIIFHAMLNAVGHAAGKIQQTQPEKSPENSLEKTAGQI